MSLRPGPRTRTRVVRYRDGEVRERRDHLATEEPLEIRIDAPGGPVTAAITMRTPGHDFELAAGFLLSEGLVQQAEDIRSVRYCVDGDLTAEQRFNTVTVQLGGAATPDAILTRHFTVSSACGVCGTTSLEDLADRGITPVLGDVRVAPEVLSALPDRLREAQTVFDRTGGLHAAARFDADGSLLEVREDVGRHNALDKLIGARLLADELPLRDAVVLVSGRASYELVAKCAVAGAPVLAAVSAPSSLAVQLAERFGITLVGFLRGDRFNVYAGAQRIIAAASLSRSV